MVVWWYGGMVEWWNVEVLAEILLRGDRMMKGFGLDRFFEYWFSKQPCSPQHFSESGVFFGLFF
jgi:hypothetical protein